MRSADKCSGFSLIEIVIGLGLVSIVVSSLLSVIQLSTFITRRVEGKDRIAISALYSLEYIKDEIKRADEVFPIGACEGLTEKYPDNFGFILMEVVKDNSGTKYNYKTYYLGEGTIKRIAVNNSVRKLPLYTRFAGHNVVAEDVVSINGTCLDTDNQLIKIHIELQGDDSKSVYRTAALVKGRVVQ